MSGAGGRGLLHNLYTGFLVSMGGMALILIGTVVLVLFLSGVL